MLARHVWTLTRLLVSSKATQRDCGDLIDQLITKTNTSALLAFWAKERLTVVAGRRYLTHTTDARVKQAVMEAQAIGSHDAALCELATRQLQVELARCGIDSVSLKGPALARRIYDDPAARAPYADIDLLVAPSDLHHASRALIQLGWRPPADAVDPSGFPILHLQHRTPTAPHSVDLHWRPHWLAGHDRHTQDIFATAVTDAGLRVPDIVNTLLVLLAAHARDGHSHLRIPADIAACWDAQADPLAALSDALDRNHALRDALQLPMVMAHGLVGVPSVPPAPARARAARLIGRALSRPLPAGPELAKRAIVDSATNGGDLAGHWKADWFPRRRRLERPAQVAGWAIRRVLL